MPDLTDRYLGCLLGLACGDAVGAPVEFLQRDRFPPVRGMRGGGKFQMRPGEWTDDTAMALCLAESLLTCDGFDPLDQMLRYRRWVDEGHLSTRAHAFGIGKTVLRALMRFGQTGDPFAGSTQAHTAGNGSLMRLAPVVLWWFPHVETAVAHAARSSIVTHAALEAVDCCRLLAVVLCNALAGKPKAALLENGGRFLHAPAVQALAAGHYRRKPREDIFGSGYAVQSLEAALWCVHGTDTFEDAVLMAANLGDDADTTAAIAGQIAGALYGMGGIPKAWLSQLHQADLIADFARRIAQHAAQRAG